MQRHLEHEQAIRLLKSVMWLLLIVKGPCAFPGKDVSLKDIAQLAQLLLVRHGCADGQYLEVILDVVSQLQSNPQYKVIPTVQLARMHTVLASCAQATVWCILLTDDS